MHDQRTAECAGGSVSGLGICDVWRLELSSAQWPWLADELDESLGPLNEALARARSAHAAGPSRSTLEQVEALEYEIRLFTMMRAELPARNPDEKIVFVGPADLLGALVVATLHNVISTLGDRASEWPLPDRDAARRLTETADAAREWVRTALGCRELEMFRFDPCADPVLLR